MAYDWPGNVRQLHSVLFRAAISCERAVLQEADLPPLEVVSEGPLPCAMPSVAELAGIAGLSLYTSDGNLRPLEDIEGDVIRLAIGHYRGRMTEVARRLGIGRSTLYRKLSELGIDKAA
jgi:DNA-binding NtrC family response regulator